MNPYDRRKGPRRPGERFGRDAMNVGAMMPMMPMPAFAGVTRATLTLADLDGLAGAVAHRVERETEERVLGEADAQAQQHRREAWDEGHAAGVEHGQQSLLSIMDAQFGAQCRATIDLISSALEMHANDRQVSKDGLAESLRSALWLVSGLVDAHHQQFKPQPF